MRPSIPLVALLSAIPSIIAQQVADGLIVPFTSDLPSCASRCGPLFDVQGKCTPPNIETVDDNCFCTDSRLTPFKSGTAGVSQVCGATSCTAPGDLQAVQTWYTQFCSTAKAPTTTSGAPGSTNTGAAGIGGGSSGHSQTWLQSHYKWVIMLVMIFFFIVFGWIGACFWRKRHLKRKEKEFEMRPPIAWGPHQMQGMSGGYNYGDGVSEANRGGKSQHLSPYGHTGNKQAANAVATPANATQNNERGKSEGRGLRKKQDRYV